MSWDRKEFKELAPPLEKRKENQLLQSILTADCIWSNQTQTNATRTGQDREGCVEQCLEAQGKEKGLQEPMFHLLAIKNSWAQNLLLTRCSAWMYSSTPVPVLCTRIWAGPLRDIPCCVHAALTNCCLLCQCCVLLWNCCRTSGHLQISFPSVLLTTSDVSNRDSDNSFRPPEHTVPRAT